jgi:hypothetical protein
VKLKQRQRQKEKEKENKRKKEEEETAGEKGSRGTTMYLKIIHLSTRQETDKKKTLKVFEKQRRKNAV